MLVKSRAMNRSSNGLGIVNLRRSPVSAVTQSAVLTDCVTARGNALFRASTCPVLYLAGMQIKSRVP